MFFISNLLTLGFGSFLFAMATIKDVKNVLRSINTQCTEGKSKEEQIQALHQVREFVQMHASMKQLSK